MRRVIAGLLRKAADRISPPPRIVVHCSHDGRAVQDMLLQLKRRNGGMDLGLR